MPLYNLEAFKSPRLCGMLLDLFTRILHLPLIGEMILNHLKKKNHVQDMLQFATNGSDPHRASESAEPLLPLYYPIHEMTREEEDMHNGMVKEAPLNIKELDDNVKQQHPIGSSDTFRHWTISDYTGQYLSETITPSEAVERIIKVIEETNTSILTQMNAKELRMQASESTKRYQTGNIMGVLDGVPIIIKDGVPTNGFSITLGTSFLANPVEKDVFPIAKLREQGALVVGMANLHEMGIGTTGYNMHHGTPRNPYGKDRQHHYVTGGSSSGCAAAVSMGLVPLAIGCDGGGSIRIPSSLCGCVGLKPTFKRVAIDFTTSPSLGHMGPMTNNIHDAALAYAIMAGETDGDHRGQSQKQPPVHLHAYMTNNIVSNKSDNGGSNNSLKGVRIGIFEEHIEDADANVVSATKNAIKYIQSRGAQIVPITLPHLRETHLAHNITVTTEMMSYMEPHWQNHFTALCPESRVALTFGKSWTSTDFLAAQKVRSYAMQHMEDLFENKVDIILSPATPCIAPILQKDTLPCGQSDIAQTTTLMRYVIHGNFTGIPALVFPIAYDEETSLPISLQIQAAHWREDLLFHVAKEAQGILEEGIAKPTIFVDTLAGKSQ